MKVSKALSTRLVVINQREKLLRLFIKIPACSFAIFASQVDVITLRRRNLETYPTWCFKFARDKGATLETPISTLETSQFHIFHILHITFIYFILYYTMFYIFPYIFHSNIRSTPFVKHLKHLDSHLFHITYTSLEIFFIYFLFRYFMYPCDEKQTRFNFVHRS